MKKRQKKKFKKNFGYKKYYNIQSAKIDEIVSTFIKENKDKYNSAYVVLSKNGKNIIHIYGLVLKNYSFCSQDMVKENYTIGAISESPVREMLNEWCKNTDVVYNMEDFNSIVLPEHNELITNKLYKNFSNLIDYIKESPKFVSSNLVVKNDNGNRSEIHHMPLTLHDIVREEQQ